MNWSEIARTLAKEMNAIISADQVKRVYDIYKARKSELLAGDQEVKDLVKQTVLDTNDQLKKINKKLWAMIDGLDTRDEIRMSAIKEVLNQLRFQEQLISRLAEDFKGTNINKLEMTQIIVNSLDDLENQGFIKKIQNPSELPTIGIPTKQRTAEGGYIEDIDE